MYFNEDTTDYDEFRIEITHDPSANGFYLRAESLAGTISQHPFTSPMSGKEVEQAFAGISRANLEFTRSGPRDAVDVTKRIGARLFNAIYDTRVASLYQQSSFMAQEKGKNLRIRLVIDNDRLALLPWEFLFDPVRQDFLTLSTLSPVVRQWQWPDGPKLEAERQIDPPLRVLVIASESDDLEMSARDEIEMVNKIGKSSRSIEIVNVVLNATREDLIKAIKKESYHVLHLIMSGWQRSSDYDQDSSSEDTGKKPQQKLMLMGGNAETPELCGVDQLRRAIKDPGDIRFLLLNGDRTDWFAGQLTYNIPATLGWRGSNTVEAYLSFTRGFYSAIADGHPFEAAVTHGRKDIDLSYPGGKEWGMPVFYLQTPHSTSVRKQRKAKSIHVTGGAKGVNLSDSVRSEKQSKNPASDREMTKLEALLATAQENYSTLKTLKQEMSKSVGGVPDYIERQIHDAQSTISKLRSQLKRLTNS